MDPRRRTLASNGDNQLNSHIPLPSSALKRPPLQPQVNSRISLAPQRVPSNASARKSVAASSNFQLSHQSSEPFYSSQAPSSSQKSSQDANRRVSVFQTAVRHQPVNPHLSASHRAPMSSSNRNDHFQGFPRQSSVNDFVPQSIMPNFLSTPSANRASSVNLAHGSHMSHNAPLLPPPQTFKDPRPRDKKTVAMWQNEVYEFLQERGYQEVLTPKTLQTPTTKDFQNIFKFLVQCSDPGHRWGSNGKKFEDEVIPLLKNMGYVAVDTISKSGLQAAGSMHTWPTMLAMLHWIMMTIKLREEAMTDNRVRLDNSAESSLDDPRSEDLASTSQWLTYVGQTYPLFLQSDDFDRELHKPTLEEFFQRKKELVLSEIERLESRNSVLEQELSRLESKPSPLAAAKKEHEKLERDADRFMEYIGKLQDSNKKSEKQNEALKKSLETTESKLADALKRKAELMVKVDKQNISDVELQQISSTRSQLERSSAAAATKRLQLTESMLDLEIKTQQASDRVENLITAWKNKAVKLGLIPRAPEPFENVDFSQSVNGGTLDVSSMLPDPTVEIKPALIQLKKDAIDHRLGLTDQVLGVEENLANITESLQEKRETLQSLEDSVQQLAKQLEDDKEKFMIEINMMNEQTESIIRRANEIESSIENNRLTIDHEIQALKVRYDETKERIAKLTQDNVNEMNSLLTFIVSYKEQIKEKTLQLKHLADSAGGGSSLLASIL
ncbi:HEC/Ndc80p family-domain-containing protein [Phakopsora pachyrhizi]|uniref:Kinetochore protein NDC80 n=1 Tax=Phakopsora pachyrhizi TaxID=170000 RepID=A0AAV0AFT3_PHAPC|nr:HEC/Ndc80p family-domain-containing protein [Phakopsora pachyrhizi]KAI8449971.1 HEC/Ndc80p family-domain-containing protein [Phakopsora pachyrhizi]CAH7666999.1 HEC/Ndc80p family-domain-containing protein [Phakopsora pachyrhizi]